MSQIMLRELLDALAAAEAGGVRVGGFARQRRPFLGGRGLARHGAGARGPHRA